MKSGFKTIAVVSILLMMALKVPAVNEVTASSTGDFSNSKFLCRLEKKQECLTSMTDSVECYLRDVKQKLNIAPKKNASGINAAAVSKYQRLENDLGTLVTDSVDEIGLPKYAPAKTPVGMNLLSESNYVEREKKSK